MPKIASRLVSLTLFAIGAVLCMAAASRTVGWAQSLACAAFLTLLRLIAELPPEPRDRSRRHAVRHALRTGVRGFLAVCHVFAVYLALAWGTRMAWSVSPEMWTFIGAVTAAWLATSIYRSFPVHVPLLLPTGMIIVESLVGWLHEETLLRCDDIKSVHAPVSLLSSPQNLASCDEGVVLNIGRYPRRFWQSPDGRWLRFTSQSGPDWMEGPGRMNGILCELDLNDTMVAPRCVGDEVGKSHGIYESPGTGKVYFTAWGMRPDAQGRTSEIITTPDHGPLAIESVHRFEGSVADIFIAPKAGMLYAMSDEADAIHSVRLPGFERAGETPLPITPADIRFNEERDEGIVCTWAGGAAIHGNPLSYRFLGVQSRSPLLLTGLSWGCDWDEQARRVYMAVPNYGLLEEIDYDTGKLLNWHWLGFAIREVTIDLPRKLLYVTDFLGGYVLAVDISSGEVRNRWFVGRFPRQAKLSRDGGSLFVGTNLGVMKIELDPVR